MLGEKIEKSIKRISFAAEQAKFRNLGPLYVCFSGGKDSVVAEHLVKTAGVEYEAHYNITGLDPPELIYFMRANYPHLFWDKFRLSMWELIVKKHIPPLRHMRYCCSELKERGGEKRMCVTGVRWAESVQRRKNRTEFENVGYNKATKMLFNDNDEDRRGFEICSMKRKLITNPIVDWTDEEVWEYIQNNKLPYCSLYDEGFKRLGCIGCPMATKQQRLMEFERYPKFKELYIRAFDRMLAGMKETTSWQTGKDVFNWWLGI